ncbi:hypothetical protein HOD83_02345 [Candidatus Woesearchaeota archaeon]|nr:hypothetical protein [Candidatus Woesearchaeota archaeon]MBT4114151.1 hypothetical protein [Candidatus Woesearchaeota archaeon]MBT4248406.1 hypothetical protein [Candidatus Woesearchaeota archaeon]
MEQEDQQKTATNERIEKLEKELALMKERYIKLLERTIERNGNQKPEVSDRISNTNTAVPLEKFQLLVLLNQSKATTPDFSVSASKLKQAFSINKTERTIRDKLTSLELMNLVSSIGLKPKNYYLTAKGLQIISQQQRGLIQTL